jgi:hypothetical protein
LLKIEMEKKTTVPLCLTPFPILQEFSTHTRLPEISKSDTVTQMIINACEGCGMTGTWSVEKSTILHHSHTMNFINLVKR